VPQYLVIAFFFGLSAGAIGKIKGSSFVLWFLVGAVLPVFGTLAALFYRYERDEPRRECDECGRVIPMTDQVCRGCGADQGLPSRLLVKPG
jgi:hypothetical protein